MCSDSSKLLKRRFTRFVRLVDDYQIMVRVEAKMFDGGRRVRVNLTAIIEITSSSAVDVRRSTRFVVANGDMRYSRLNPKGNGTRYIALQDYFVRIFVRRTNS